MTVVVPVDPREVVLAWLRPLLPAILPGWSAGTRLAGTPTRFILIKVLGGSQTSGLSDRVNLAFQIWGDNGVTDDHDRTRAARIVTAHAQRGINARRASGAVPLPDPTDPARSITQITVTALMRGEDE